MPFDIATGTYTEATALQPLDATGLPAVAPVTPRTPVASGPTDSGPLVTGERDLTGERLSALAAMEADCRAAQAAGMSAENDRRHGYATDILPTGAEYGDLMTLDGGALEAGAGGGEALPVAYFYDPPRLGAPETYTAAGNEP